MDGKLLELGIGLIAAVMVIREVLNFLAKKKYGNGYSTNHAHGEIMSEHVNDVRTVVTNIKDKVDDLHDWHSKTDQDGIPLWYVKRSLEEAIKTLGERIGDQIQMQTKIIQHMQRMEEHYRNLSEKEKK